MTKSLKSLRAELYTLQLILQNTKSREECFVRYSDQERYGLFLEYIQGTCMALEKEIHSLPIGYEYTGSFYIKKPYIVPAEVIKVEGTAFMREDLVSWTIKSDDPQIEEFSYFRNIYKDERCQNRVERDDAKPVLKK